MRGRKQAVIQTKKRQVSPPPNPKKRQRPKKDANSVHNKNDEIKSDEITGGDVIDGFKVRPQEDFAGWLDESNQTIHQILEKNIKIEKGFRGYSKENFTKIQGNLNLKSTM